MASSPRLKAKFEVDFIVEYCARRKKYKVRWLGYGEEDDEWKLASEIDEQLVKDFDKVRKSRTIRNLAYPLWVPLAHV